MISEIKGGFFEHEIKDYYAILGVPIGCTAKEVRNRYIKIAYQLHPDTCTSSEPKYKEKASMILSKLVNPAYENLYKDKSRRECELIVAEMARKLASEPNSMKLSTEIANKLYQDSQNRDKIYEKSWQTIAQSQYEDLTKVLAKIAILSELNMVYAVCQQESKGILSKTNKLRSPINENPTIIVPPSGETFVDNENKPKVDPPDLSTSRLSKLIESAKQRQEKGNIAAAILDLREALKIDPNNSTAHALIASLYMAQDNLIYAKVHLKKALELEPNNATAKEIKEELKAKKRENNSGKKPSKRSQKSRAKSSSSKAKKSSGKSKDKEETVKFFGIPIGKSSGKKEPPKIFGIPLW